MADQFKWPDFGDNYPEVVEGDRQIEFKKELYRRKLELIKNVQLARIAQERAKGEAWIAQEKAALDAQIAQARARLDSELRRAEMKLQAEINTEALKAAVQAEQNRALWANEYAISQAYQAAYIEVAKRQLERAARPAEFVQRMAALLGGVYLGLLALTVVANVIARQSVGGDMLLPIRGIAPTLFFGLAIVLASASASACSLNDPGKFANGDAPGGTVEAWQRARRNAFVAWATATSSNRMQRYALQTAVLSLGAGVCFLPVAYLAILDSDAFFVGIAAVVAIFLLPLLALLGGWVMGKDGGLE